MKYGTVLEADDLAGLPVKPGDRVTYETMIVHPDGGKNRMGGTLMKRVEREGTVRSVEITERTGHPMQYTLPSGACRRSNRHRPCSVQANGWPLTREPNENDHERD